MMDNNRPSRIGASGVRVDVLDVRSARAAVVEVVDQVGELRGVSSGRARVVRGSVDLWRDDRPPLSREEFSVLRKAAFAVLAERGTGDDDA